MNNNWYHSVKGRYSIGDKWVGLDYSKHLLKPEEATLTLVHEVTHGILASQTDFGQGTGNIIFLLEKFTNLTRDEKERLATCLIESQEIVQEGFATLMEVLRLSERMQKSEAIKWAEKNCAEDYFKWFSEMSFVLKMSLGYREHFTKKVSYIVLENGFRRALVEDDLLSNVYKLENYLKSEDVNPNARLRKLLETLKYKPWLVTRPLEEIATACDVTYFTPTTKQEAALYLTYLTSFTNNPFQFQPEHIKDTPRGQDAMQEITDSLLVANMNLDFENGDFLTNLDDFLNYADVFQLLLLNIHDESTPNLDWLEQTTGMPANIGAIGFLKTGEKYMTSMSFEKAEEVLTRDLKDVPLMVKWGVYNSVDNCMIWSKSARKPDLIVYNTPQDLKHTLEVVRQTNTQLKNQYLHMGAGEGHPLQSLLVKIGQENTLHVVNTYGNKRIQEILDMIKPYSTVLSKDQIRGSKMALNGLMSVWMGLSWDIDWVESMLDGEVVYFRK